MGLRNICGLNLGTFENVSLSRVLGRGAGCVGAAEASEGTDAAGECEDESKCCIGRFYVLGE